MASVARGFFTELFDSNRGREGLAESSCVRIFAVYATPMDVAKRRHLVAPGIPQIAQPHPYDDQMVVVDVAGAARLSEDVVTVVVTYSNSATRQPWNLTAISYNREVPYFERIQFTPVSTATAAGTAPVTGVVQNHWLQKTNHIPTPRSVLEYEVRYPYKRNTQYPISGAELNAILAQRGQIHRMSIPYAVTRITAVEGTVTEWQFVGAHISASDTGQTIIKYTWTSDSATPAQVLVPPANPQSPNGNPTLDPLLDPPPLSLQPTTPPTTQGPSGTAATLPDFVLAPYRPPFWEYRTVSQVRTQGPAAISQPLVVVYDPWSGNRNNSINPNGLGWRQLKGFQP